MIDPLLDGLLVTSIVLWAGWVLFVQMWRDTPPIKKSKCTKCQCGNQKS